MWSCRRTSFPVYYTGHNCWPGLSFGLFPSSSVFCAYYKLLHQPLSSILLCALPIIVLGLVWFVRASTKNQSWVRKWGYERLSRGKRGERKKEKNWPHLGFLKTVEEDDFFYKLIFSFLNELFCHFLRNCGKKSKNQDWKGSFLKQKLRREPKKKVLS